MFISAQMISGYTVAASRSSTAPFHKDEYKMNVSVSRFLPLLTSPSYIFTHLPPMHTYAFPHKNDYSRPLSSRSQAWLRLSTSLILLQRMVRVLFGFTFSAGMLGMKKETSSRRTFFSTLQDTVCE